MGDINDDIFCKECNSPLKLSDKVCPKCGCNKRLIKVVISDSIAVSANIDKMKAKRRGVKKPLWEYLSRNELWRDKGKIVHKFRDINRIENKYEEVVTDVENGEIIHECREPLTEHYGHGSAKKRD